MAKGDRHGTTWKLSPHTAAKHELLRNYLGAWFPILSRYQGRVLVLDGFAGPGVYEGGQDGSPRIVVSALLDHRYAAMLDDCEFLLYFNERDDKRFAELDRQIELMRQGYGGWPKNVRVVAFNESFPDLAEAILDGLGEQSLAPTFAFLDPFGYQDVPIDLIRRLLAYRRSELFIYFDFNSVNRFSTAGNVDHHFEALFGTTEFMNAPPAGDPGRGPFLHDLYERQLQEVAGFDYVRSFEMVNKQGRTGNYLFFCTRSIDGLDKMKQAMWKVAPAGNYRFDDRNIGMLGLFDKDVDTLELRARLVDAFRGQTVSIEDLRTFTITETPFTSSHLKRRTLAPMKREGLIDVDPPQRRADAYPDGSFVTFKT